MENLLKNELFTHVSAEELEKMIPCFEMTKRSFREKDIIPTHEGGKNYICLLLSGTVSVNRISIDGSLDLLEYLEDTGVFGAAFPFRQVFKKSLRCEYSRSDEKVIYHT